MKMAKKKPATRKPKLIAAPKELQAMANQERPNPPQTQTDMLIQLAADKDFPVEKLEKLIDLKNREEERLAKKEFDFHFAQMQAEIPVFSKSKQGYKYKYTPIEVYMKELKPILARHLFSCSWYQETMGTNRPKIWNVISGYGYDKKCSIELNIVEVSDMTNEIQDTGSAKSYGRRYTLKDNLGLVEENEDDDGASAAPPHDQSESSNNPACPSCNSNAKVIISKWPKNGKYFCLPCKKGFNAQSQSAEPDEDSMSKEEREMICRELSEDEIKAFRAEVLDAAKIGGDKTREVRKKYRELYKARLTAKNASTEIDDADIPF
jgi:hypothetical protein